MVVAKTQAAVAEKRFGKQPQLQLSEVEAVWLACAIDGEGTIGVYRQKRKDGRAQYKYNPIIHLYNTNFDFIAHAKRLVGGCGYVCTDKHPNNRGYKTLYTLRLSNRAVAVVIEQLTPHLIIKKQQAEVVKRFCSAVASASLQWGQDHDHYEALYWECRALNKRGTTS